MTVAPSTTTDTTTIHKDHDMKTLLTVITLALLTITACTAPPGVGRAESALSYTDGGMAIINDEASMTEAWKLTTGCATTPTEWWEAVTTDKDYTGYDTGIVGDESEHGLISARRNCVWHNTGVDTQNTSWTCSDCCDTVRVCATASNGTRICWDEVRCYRSSCLVLSCPGCG